MSVAKAHFIVNMMIVKAGHLVKIKIAIGRKVQVKEMIALTVIRGTVGQNPKDELFFFLLYQLDDF